MTNTEPNIPPIREIREIKDRKERKKLVRIWFNEYMKNRGRLEERKVVIASEDEDFWRYYEDEIPHEEEQNEPY